MQNISKNELTYVYWQPADDKKACGNASTCSCAMKVFSCKKFYCCDINTIVLENLIDSNVVMRDVLL